jgi:hypothetical protein
MLGHYAFCPASPWWLTLCPSKWFSLGMGLLLGTDPTKWFSLGMGLRVPLVERPSILDLTCGTREGPCLSFFLSAQHFLMVEGIGIWGSHIV